MIESGISVVMTTYNGAKYVRKQIDSILAQTLQPDEIIICDDRSADDTPAILQLYSSDSRFRMFFNTQQLGVVKNFQSGCAAAKANNRIAFCDQDDIWLPQKLARLDAEMQKIDDGSTPALVYSDLKIIDKDDDVVAESFWQRQKMDLGDVSFRLLLFGNALTGCTMFINSPMLKEFLVMNAEGYFHDEWLGLIAYSFGKVKRLPEQLVLYRQHGSNVTFSDSYQRAAQIGFIKRELALLTGKTKFLARQFPLARFFYEAYSGRLKPDHKHSLEKFIRLENQGYLFQRYARFAARKRSAEAKKENKG